MASGFWGQSMPKSGTGCGVGIDAVRWGVGVLVVAMGVQPAMGQELDDFEQRGIRWGSVNIFSELGVGFVYTDNVFAVPDEGIPIGSQTLPKDSDLFFLLQPQVVVESDLERHRLYFLGNASIARYETYSSQDFNDFTLEGGGTWDVSRTFAIDAFVGYDQLHESASDPDRRSFFDTSTFDQFRAGLGASKDWGRTFATYTFRFDDRNYGEELVGGVDVNAGRDRSRYRNNVRVGYDVTRQYDLFVELSHRLSDFENLPAPALDRDQQQFGVLFGTEVDIDRLVVGEFSVGVDYSTYDDGITSDQVGFAFAGGLDWILSPRTTLGVAASRSFEPTDRIGASGRQVTALDLTLSYALSPRFTLGAGAGYEIDDLIDLDGDDETLTAGASAAYAFNRYFSVRAAYDYTNRTSDVAVREYDENLVSLSLVGRY